MSIYHLTYHNKNAKYISIKSETARAYLLRNLNDATTQGSDDRLQSRSQSMPVRGLCSDMPLHNPRTGILWERDWIDY